MSNSNDEKLQRRNRELSILNDIAQALNRSIDLDQALQAALARVAQLLDLHTGWVWLLREESGESYLAASQNLPPALADHPRRMEGSCYCLDTFREGDLAGAANVNVVTCSRLKWLLDGTGGLRYHASIPLYAHGRKLGVLNVASPDWRELSTDDLRLLHTIGDLLGIAVERARLFERSTQLGAVEERNRVARELHDTLAQGLAALTLQLESVDALLETSAESERVRQVVQQALALTRSNLEEARRSVLDLRAAPLQGRNLAGALAELVDGLPVPVNLEVTGGERPLSPRIEVGLYRIAQEALNNAVQHAAATAITVRLVTTPDQIRLVVADNGRGFDPDQTPANRFGLVGLNERTRLLNGRLTLESSPGEGTRIEVVVGL